jgi:hypothetical protein
MLTTQQSVAARIKALLSKTTDNGCTEAEAMSAAEKARELMDRYNIDRGEVGMEEEGVYAAKSPLSKFKSLCIRELLASRIASFCDCRAWFTRGGVGTLTFFGLRSDADFAVWLSENLDQFVQRAAIEYMARQPRAKRGPDLLDALADIHPLDARELWEREKGFVLGAVGRINERLRELEQLRRTGAGTGRSLVVVKSAMVEREFIKLGMNLRPGRGTSVSSRDGGARAAGYAAGNQASFGRPINGGRGLAAIGRG